MSRLLKLNPNFTPAFDGLKIAGDLLGKLSRGHKVIEAYLFGSSAEGKNTSDSDLDILVVVPEASDKKIYFSFVNAPFYSPIAVDWIFVTESEFTQQMDLGGVVRKAALNGRKIFPKGQDQKNDPT